jgi:uncharacterized membrane protein YkvA (DUF1232 family)
LKLNNILKFNILISFKDQINKRFGNMETNEKRHKENNKNGGSIKVRLSHWMSKHPKLDKLTNQTAYYVKHPDEFSAELNKIYNKATSRGENKTLAEYGAKISALFRMAKMTLSNEYKGIPKIKIIIGAAVIFYLISPYNVDTSPGFLPFFGFADDAVLLLWLIKNSAEEVDKFESWEKSERNIEAVTPV